MIMAQAKVKVGYDEVVPRDLTFNLTKENVHKYWFNDDPWNTIWMSAVLAAVPEGERWVMRSAAMLLDKITDPAIREAGVNFCKQERIHAREHDVMNNISIEHGLPLDKIESTFVVIREFLKKNLSPEMQGALAGSFEHFTAILSSVFLVSYIIYHYNTGHTSFGGEGWIRPVYFTLLISHIILATAILPMALLSMYRGLANQISKHKSIAKWTFPIWLYVAISGVLVYLLMRPYYPF